MPTADTREAHSRGFSVVELTAAVAIVGVAVVIALPTLVGYFRAVKLSAGAHHLRSTLTIAKQLAIRQNTSICVDHSAAGVRLFTGGSCSGTPWTGAGSDRNGWFALANGVRIANGPGAPIVFSSMGAATPAGTYTIRSPENGAQTLTVTVAGSGRITVP